MKCIALNILVFLINFFLSLSNTIKKYQIRFEIVYFFEILVLKNWLGKYLVIFSKVTIYFGVFFIIIALIFV